VNENVPPATTNPARYFHYDGWNLIQEGPSTATADRIYVHGGRVDEIVASQAAGGQWAYHHYDARGHCILLTNPWSGTIIEQYDYDAFGWPYFHDSGGNDIGSSSWGNRFLFTGREWIKDLRLYDYRNRMYHPELGRFLQPDPKHFGAGDYNLYRYCHNDPVNRADPMGLYEYDGGEGNFDGSGVSSNAGRIINGGVVYNPVEVAMLNTINGVGSQADGNLITKFAPTGFLPAAANGLNNCQGSSRLLLALAVAASLPGGSQGPGSLNAAQQAAIGTARSFLGNGFTTLTNRAGDKIFTNADRTLRLRFDVNNSHGDKPHFHVEKSSNGRNWKDAGSQHRYYFKEKK
jgi:RHS repeat-associated protein